MPLGIKYNDTGQILKYVNFTYFTFLAGLLREPDLTGFGLLDEEEDDADEKSGDKPKKKKIRRDLALLRKQKNDPNAPTANRMPLPDLRDSDKAEKAKALREIFRRQDLSTSLPSIVYYTALNSCSSPSAVEICDDSRFVNHYAEKY